MFPMSTVILFCIYFYVLKMGDIRSVYDQANGIWWQNRFRAIAEAAANLILNYFLGKYWGVKGIIAATLVSLFLINFCYGSQIIFKYYFKGQPIREYFHTNFIFAAVTLAVAGVTYSVCSMIKADGVIEIIVKGAICVVVPNILYFGIYFKTRYFKDSVPWILSRLKQIRLRRNR